LSSRSASESPNDPERGRPEAEPEIAVGLIRAPHGIKGLVRVKPLTDDPGRFERLTQVTLELRSGERRSQAVEETRVGADRVLLKFRGLDDRGAVEPLRGAYVLIPRSEAIELPEGQYFVDDIVGLEVVTVDGKHLGPVREVLRTGANDVYATDSAMIPATREVVRKIDIAAGIMIVDLPEEI
jgi:16S rRNA processing protein RimM